MVQDLEELLSQVNAAMEVNEVDNDVVIDPNVANPEMVDVDPFNTNLINVPQEALDFLNILKISMDMEVANSEPEDVNNTNPVPEDIEMMTLIRKSQRIKSTPKGHSMYSEEKELNMI